MVGLCPAQSSSASRDPPVLTQGPVPPGRVGQTSSRLVQGLVVARRMPRRGSGLLGHVEPHILS